MPVTLKLCIATFLALFAVQLPAHAIEIACPATIQVKNTLENKAVYDWIIGGQDVTTHQVFGVVFSQKGLDGFLASKDVTMKGNVRTFEWNIADPSLAYQVHCLYTGTGVSLLHDLDKGTKSCRTLYRITKENTAIYDKAQCE